MKKLLLTTSLIELSLGIFLILMPATVLSLLFGWEESGHIILLARLAGIVYVCFGIACYPSNNPADENKISMTFIAMFLYNFLAAIFLGYIRFGENFEGVLLLPAVIFHSLITIYFVFVFKNIKKQ